MCVQVSVETIWLSMHGGGVLLMRISTVALTLTHRRLVASSTTTPRFRKPSCLITPCLSCSVRMESLTPICTGEHPSMGGRLAFTAAVPWGLSDGMVIPGCLELNPDRPAPASTAAEGAGGGVEGPAGGTPIASAAAAPAAGLASEMPPAAAIVAASVASPNAEMRWGRLGGASSPSGSCSIRSSIAWWCGCRCCCCCEWLPKPAAAADPAAAAAAAIAAPASCMRCRGGLCDASSSELLMSLTSSELWSASGSSSPTSRCPLQRGSE